MDKCLLFRSSLNLLLTYSCLHGTEVFCIQFVVWKRLHCLTETQTHVHTHPHNDRQPQLFAYARRLESHIVDIEVDGPGATAESRFTVSVQRRNPAQMGVVTGHATYASFYSSLIGMGESTHAHTCTHTHTHMHKGHQGWLDPSFPSQVLVVEEEECTCVDGAVC